MKENEILYEEDKKVNKDNVATPRYVVESIYKKINVWQFKEIWFPFNHYDSEFKLYADELKLQYTATHIFDDLGNDFFKTDPPLNCDLMISNPPFSKQNQIINRSFDLIDRGLIKSFALLLPTYTFDTIPRMKVYEQYLDKLSIIFIGDRIEYLGFDSGFKVPCCWVCYNIPNLPPISFIVANPEKRSKRLPKSIHIRKQNVVKE